MASTKYWLPFDGISRVTVPMTGASPGTPSSARARAISSADRGFANSSSGAPRYTTCVRSAGTSRARVVNSAVDFDTATAMSVKGASALSAAFWKSGVSVWFACSCNTVGNRRIAAAARPNVVAPYPCMCSTSACSRSISLSRSVSVAGSNLPRDR